MVKSMTGFGRCEVSDAARKITVELKSVNHRFLDINIRMPKKLSFFEASMRALIKEYTERGKLDVFVTYDDYTDQDYNLKYNRKIAAAYLNYIRDMAEEFGLENDLTVSRLSRYPEVFSLEEQGIDDDELWKEIEKAFRGALKEFTEERVREGENLKNDLIGKLKEMSSLVSLIEERAPEIIEEYKRKLFERVKELMADASVEENRILAEVTIFADKICVDEELVRLKSHINAMIQALETGGGLGRKLDFIAQEMNREANTILSKANDLITSESAIELKTLIEKVREQIQNIE